MIWIVVFLTVLVTALFIVELIIAAPPYLEKNSDHFDGKKFVNPGTLTGHTYFDVLRWWFSGNNKGPWQKLTKNDISDRPKPQAQTADHELRITFVNHATFLIQIDGMNILTDPIWSYRASPFQWIGPKRMRPPGIKFEDLPPIDLVLISHNHYDHLDEQTVLDLHRDHNPKFVMPLGVERFFHDHNIDTTTHLDWWHHHEVNQRLSLTAVPARHFSGRGLFDRNKTLWCGYVLHTPFGNIYFAGDTGYGDFLTEIGQNCGPIHTSFLPIGAYKPRWFMQPIHMSPEEAVQAHKDLQSEQSIAMHFGTFPMADDGMREGVEELQEARKLQNISSEEFRVLQEGETVIQTKQPSARTVKAAASE